MKIRNDGNEEWKSDNVSNETGNNITIKSEELDPTVLRSSGTINLNVRVKPQPVVNFKKLLRLKHDKG
jgi:hypothetical protein